MEENLKNVRSYFVCLFHTADGAAPCASDLGSVDTWRDLCKRMDRRAERDRDLRINQMHRCGSRDHYGGDLQFLRSNGHVAHQFERGDDHKEHGKFWRKQ